MAEKTSTIVTTGFLSLLWAVSKVTIIEWAQTAEKSKSGAAGWLRPAKVGHGKFDGPKAHQLYIENMVIPKFARSDDDSESMEEAKRRKEIAVANLKELDEQERRGELIDRSQAVDWVGSLVDEARTAFQALPRRMAPILYGKEIRDSEATLRKEVNRILNKLARPLNE